MMICDTSYLILLISFLDNLTGKMDLLNLEEPSLASSSSMTSLGEASNMSEMSRDLASGSVAPIAARESVFKYQMALKEDQVILHKFVLTDLLGLSQVKYDF